MECAEGKDSWPELVGVPGTEAKEIIERENPLVRAIIVRPGESVITDVDCRRVWVRVNDDGIVWRVPTIG